MYLYILNAKRVENAMCDVIQTVLKRISVEEFTAATRAARARYFILFEWEFVVVGEFFAADNLAQRKDNDVFVAEDLNDFRVTIWL